MLPRWPGPGRGGARRTATAEFETPPSPVGALRGRAWRGAAQGFRRASAAGAAVQLVDFAPMIQILDALVPQMVDQLVDVLGLLDAAIPEQVIAVPKISLHPVSSRGLLPPRRWRNSWWKCRCLPCHECAFRGLSPRRRFWHWSGTPLTTRGSRSGGHEGSTGGGQAP